jgi:DNA modification methylase
MQKYLWHKLLNKIICGDCIEVLGKIHRPFADLIIADPPFNIGYKYDNYNDNIEKAEYLAWSKKWINECYRVLKNSGSFYIAIGDEFVADIKLMAEEKGLFMRNWIIWHYTFGQQTKNKFARAHTHILYFVKDKNNFTFIGDTLRVISDRQKVYKDKRAYREGKMPDDVWDEYPRICGTFEERMNFPCQMPESLLARIIRVSSKPKKWVLDPFSGSGTTAVVAAKLGRKYTGIEISSDYVEKSRRRIEEFGNTAVEGEEKRKWTQQMDKELKWLYHENKVSTEQLSEDDYLLTLFTEKFNLRILNQSSPFSPKEISKRLTYLRKSAKLGALRGERIRTNNKKRYNSEELRPALKDLGD